MNRRKDVGLCFSGRLSEVCVISDSRFLTWLTPPKIDHSLEINFLAPENHTYPVPTSMTHAGRRPSMIPDSLINLVPAKHTPKTHRDDGYRQTTTNQCQSIPVNACQYHVSHSAPIAALCNYPISLFYRQPECNRSIKMEIHRGEKFFFLFYFLSIQDLMQKWM